jgi:hypothetical protein
MSFWPTAMVAATRAVSTPTTAITVVTHSDDAAITGLMRVSR